MLRSPLRVMKVLRLCSQFMLTIGAPYTWLRLRAPERCLLSHCEAPSRNPSSGKEVPNGSATAVDDIHIPFQAVGGGEGGTERRSEMRTYGVKTPCTALPAAGIFLH